MSEPAEVETTLETVEATAEDGYIGFEVRASVSKDYQSFATTLHYRYAAPVDALDLVEKHAEAAQKAAELAGDSISHLLAKSATAAASATRAPAGADTSSAAPSGGDAATPAGARTVLQGTKPRNSGTLNYVPTSDLSEQDFKTEIAQAIRAAGGDPDELAIFDNRKGKFGVEDGKESWSTASVLPKQDTHMASILGDKKKAYFVDFDANGKVSVKATDAYTQYKQMAAAFEK